MVFTEEGKAFIKILNQIIDYGLRKITSEFSSKRWKRSGLVYWATLSMKVLKKWMSQSERKHGSGIPRLCVGHISLTSDAIVRL